MKKILNLSMIALVASLVTGCATSSDVENLQAQVNDLNASVAQVSADSASAQAASAEAAAMAQTAEAESKRANQTISRRFHKKFRKHR